MRSARTAAKNKRSPAREEAGLQDIFMRFHQKIAAAFRARAKDMPFTMPQLEALRFVVEEGDPTMKDVARHLDVTAPSATSMIEQLCDKKLIKRRLDPSDRRTVHIFPTPKAAKLFASFAEMKARIFGSMISGLDASDRKELVRILTKLI